MKAVLKTIGWFLYFVLMVASIFAKAYVGVILWRWFLVEPFAIRAISMAEVLGLTLVLGYFMPTFAGYWDMQKLLHPDYTETQIAVSRLVYALALPWLALLIGWLFKLYLFPYLDLLPQP